MAYLELAERAVVDVLAYFTANLNTKLAEIDAGWGDFELRAVDEDAFLDHDPVEPETYPCFYVLGNRGTIPGGEGGSLMERIDLSAWLWLYEDADDSKRWKRSYRYAAAIVQLLRTFEAQSSILSIVGEPTFEFLSILAPEDNYVWGGVEVQFAMHQYETI